ncbi:hypothetical protein [Williamsia sp. CHRR-6]|uniref:hypothetical protein n=1 Tax=Williamsia sp. CHRR-6 TaxID=2835871 RepID=UPI001BDA2CD7|nr:hypothetical protein [Williamsia sp. CHRR-6]MBT0567276.1 hypothetical protein [Williamsia sp. CHRR-6]
MIADAPEPELSTVVTAGAGGVMTDEVGVITGSVELASRRDADGVGRVRVRYEGAAEWYTVSDVARPLASDGDLAAFHDAVVTRLRG